MWVTVWLLPLLEAAGDVRGPVSGTALALFVGLYILVVWTAFEYDGRHRLRTAGYVVQGTIALSLAAAYGDHWLVVLMFMAAASAAAFGDEDRPVLAVGLMLAWTTTIAVTGAAHGVHPAKIGATCLAALLSSALVLVVRQMIRAIRQLHETRRALAEAAVTEERLRFARDLHDLLGHTLSLIVVKAEVVRRLAERDPAAAVAQAADIEAVGRHALVEIREAVTGYRSTGLGAELAHAREALSAAGIGATVRRDAAHLPPATDTLLAWVVREATTNVVRHSGAKRCDIDVTTDPAGVTVEVRDDGSFTGAGPVPAGHGLTGLAERLAAAGGTLATAPRDGGGLVLSARLPLEPR